MPDALARFLVFNVTLSIVAAVVGVLVVLGITRVLGLRDSRSRNSLMTLAIAKSAIVLVGAGQLLPFLGPDLEGNALAPQILLPFALIWIGLVVLWQRAATNRLLASQDTSSPSVAQASRIEAAIERVWKALRPGRTVMAGGQCCPIPELARPSGRLVDTKTSPALTAADPPVLLMPAMLMNEFDGDELDAVVAHEVAHSIVQSGGAVCGPRWLRTAALATPGGAVIARLMDRDEELACDDIATQVTQKPEALASALVKTYRFTRERSRGGPLGIAYFLGGPGWLKHRIARLATPSTLPEAPPRVRLVAAWCIGALLLLPIWPSI